MCPAWKAKSVKGRANSAPELSSPVGGGVNAFFASLNGLLITPWRLLLTGLEKTEPGGGFTFGSITLFAASAIGTVGGEGNFSRC